jgi:hypothetical protein
MSYGACTCRTSLSPRGCAQMRASMQMRASISMESYAAPVPPKHRGFNSTQGVLQALARGRRWLVASFPRTSPCRLLFLITVLINALGQQGCLVSQRRIPWQQAEPHIGVPRFSRFTRDAAETGRTCTGLRRAIQPDTIGLHGARRLFALDGWPLRFARVCAAPHPASRHSHTANRCPLTRQRCDRINF